MLYNLHRAKEAMRKEAVGDSGGKERGCDRSHRGRHRRSGGDLLGPRLLLDTLRRFKVTRIVINLDPDSAGARGVEKSIGVPLEESMQVRIMIDGGLDPDVLQGAGRGRSPRTHLSRPRDIFTGWPTRRAQSFDTRTIGGNSSYPNTFYRCEDHSTASGKDDRCQ